MNSRWPEGATGGKVYRAIWAIEYPWWYRGFMRRHLPIWLHRRIPHAVVYHYHLVHEFHVEGADTTPVDWATMDNSEALTTLKREKHDE